MAEADRFLCEVSDGGTVKVTESSGSRSYPFNVEVQYDREARTLTLIVTLKIKDDDPVDMSAKTHEVVDAFGNRILVGNDGQVKEAFDSNGNRLVEATRGLPPARFRKGQRVSYKTHPEANQCETGYIEDVWEPNDDCIDRMYAIISERTHNQLLLFAQELGLWN